MRGRDGWGGGREVPWQLCLSRGWEGCRTPLLTSCSCQNLVSSEHLSPAHAAARLLWQGCRWAGFLGCTLRPALGSDPGVRVSA